MNNSSSGQRNLWVNYPKTYIAQRNPRNSGFSGCEGFRFATLSENTLILLVKRVFIIKTPKFINHQALKTLTKEERLYLVPI